MAGLTGRNIKGSYGDLLHISNNNIGVDSTSRNVEDGGGTATTLHLSTTGMKNTGTTILGSGVEDGSTANYPHVLHGDVLVRADGSANGAVLTIENVQEDADDATDDAVLILHSDDPRLDFLDRNDSSVAADKRLFRLGYQNGVFKFESQYGDGTNAVEVLKLTAAGGPGGSPRSVLGPGNAEDGYAHTIHGDVIIKDTNAGQEALLTLNSEGSDAQDLAALSLFGTSSVIVFQDTSTTTAGRNRQHIGMDNGSLNFAIYSDDGLTLHGIPLKIAPGADPATQRNIIMEDLPATDPSVTNALWARGGQLMVSGSTRHVYDSGWVTQWGSTTLAANVFDAVTLPSDVDDYFPFQLNIWGRLASSPDTVYPIDITAQATNTSGVQVAYDTSTRALTLYFQDNAGTWEVMSGLGTVAAWGGSVDEIRVTIRK